MIQSCIVPNSVGRLLQYEQRRNAACNASWLEENLSERINDIYGNQAKSLLFQHQKAAICPPELTQSFFDNTTVPFKCPAQSSDLNTIEYFWLFIKNRVSNTAQYPPIKKDTFI